MPYCSFILSCNVTLIYVCICFAPVFKHVVCPQGGFCWASKGNLNTVTHCVCLRSSAVTTWSLYLNKLNGPVIKNGWLRNAVQVNAVERSGLGKCDAPGVMRKSTYVFSDNNTESEQQTINTDFTFELFICAAILLEHRETLLRCSDEVQLIQFTSRFVARLIFFIYLFCEIFPAQKAFLFFKATDDTFVPLILATVFRESWI